MPTPTLEALSSLRSADTVGAVDVVAARALAAVLVDDLALDGYRQHFDHAEQTTSVLQLAPESTYVSIRAFRELLSTRARHTLTSAQDLATAAAGRRRVHATRRLLERRERGATTYLRTLAEHVRDLLPDATDDDLLTARACARARREAQREIGPAVPLDRAARRRAQHADDSREARRVFAAWLLALPDGVHDLADVWDAWIAALDGTGEAWRRAHPELFRDGGGIGKQNGYAAIRDLLPVVTQRSARARAAVVVDYHSRLRGLLADRTHRSLVKALRLQQERHSHRV